MLVRSKGARGFTLIELVIVVAVIAILAALLIPTILNQVDRARSASERQSINELAKAIRRFKADTASWPYDNTYWPAATNSIPDEFTFNDTALFVMPTPALPNCSPANIGLYCWGGPYLATSQGSSINPGFIDTWGRARLFVFIRPFDGMGGGTPGAPNGFITVWSRGPDNIDSYGCYGGGCTTDYDKMAKGQTSAATTPTGGVPDDIVMLVGAAR